MRVFLTLWDNNKEIRTTKTIECYKLTVYDGAEINVDGDKLQLFNVIASDDIIPHVATIEIL